MYPTGAKAIAYVRTSLKDRKRTIVRTKRAHARFLRTYVHSFVRTSVQPPYMARPYIPPYIRPKKPTSVHTKNTKLSDFRTFGFLDFQTLLDLTAPYCTLLDLTGPYWTLLDPTGPYWTLLQRIRIRTFVATALSNVRRDGVI